MTFPNDPAMLVSVLNTRLRDYYSSLDDLCEDTLADRQALIDKCRLIGYEYSQERNQFI